jgi:hypothetical protein
MIRWIGWCSLAISIVAFRGAVPNVVAQAPSASSKLKTFISPDGAFQFSYPESLSGGPQMRGSYIPVCDNDAIVCLKYPEDEYRGYNFEAAAFSVTALPRPTTRAKCLSYVGDRTCKPMNTTVRGGVKFATASCGEGGLGHNASGPSYRTYHRGTCYQLSVRIATSEFVNFPEGSVQEFSRADREKVEQLLRIPVESFRLRN